MSSGSTDSDSETTSEATSVPSSSQAGSHTSTSDGELTLKELFDRGLQSLIAQDYEGAERDLLAVIAEDPRSSVAYYRLGIMYAKTHQYAEAVPHFAMAVQLNPQDYYKFNRRALEGMRMCQLRAQRQHTETNPPSKGEESSSNPSSNSQCAPSRSLGSKDLCINETVEILSRGQEWTPCAAILDTGNAGHTVVSPALMRELGLEKRVRASASETQFIGIGGHVQTAKLVRVCLRLKGEKVLKDVKVAVADLPGGDCLIGRKGVLDILFGEGYRVTGL